jgi:hypothetical protein
MAKKKVTTADVVISPWDVGGMGSGAAGALFGATRRVGAGGGERGVAAARAGAGSTRFRVRTEGAKAKHHHHARKGKATAPVKKEIRKHLAAARRALSKLHAR